MDRARIALMRDLLAGTGWVERTRSFGQALRRAPHDVGGLLLVGTPTEEPWHFAAHLDDEARWSDLPGLAPVLVRWSPPPNAPAHLAVGLQRLEQIARGETVFVVAPDAAPEQLLERVADARRIGATVFALDAGNTELEGLAHESLWVPGVSNEGSNEGIVVPEFDVVSHLVSAAAGESTTAAKSRIGAFRRRLGRVLDAVSDSDGADAETKRPR
ncbi:MAG TPA: hypothetical protein VFG00_06305 [Acidothermaceae bacterium]|nr:hypothetical protein [Acidothermaceae bacterium]